MAPDLNATEGPPFSQAERKWLRIHGFDLDIQQWEHVIVILSKLKRDIPVHHSLYRAIREKWIEARLHGMRNEINAQQTQAMELFCKKIFELTEMMLSGLVTMLKVALQTGRQIKCIQESFKANEEACDVSSEYSHGRRIRFRHCGKRFSDLTPDGSLTALWEMFEHVSAALLDEMREKRQYLTTSDS
ncbi:MAG: hypothetical protein Q9208_001398 [Pyrenodesmia sp. 3 TL-2023]